MKIVMPQIRAAVALFAVLAGPVVCTGAQNGVLEPSSTLSLSGDSTLHPFTSTATVLVLKASWDEVDKNFGTASLEKNALKEFRLTIPVKGLKSKDSGLDKNMYKALKADQYPDIIFEMSRYEVTPSTRSTSAFHVKTDGVLQVAGQKQQIVLEMEAAPAGDALRARGTYSLLMTNFGIKPPTMMMGTIKVKNEVVIYFDLLLR